MNAGRYRVNALIVPDGMLPIRWCGSNSHYRVWYQLAVVLSAGNNSQTIILPHFNHSVDYALVPTTGHPSELNTFRSDQLVVDLPVGTPHFSLIVENIIANDCSSSPDYEDGRVRLPSAVQLAIVPYP
jgi:hypothetical protein